MVSLGIAEVVVLVVICGGVLLVLVLVAGIGAAFARRRPSGTSGKDALTTLKRRLAAGEIDEQAYERLRARIVEEETSAADTSK